jgi:hypothetical protein
MWDELFASEAANVTGSVSGKDAKGVTRTVKYGVAPADINDDAAWINAAEDGVQLSQKGQKNSAGASKQNSLKEVKGAKARNAVSRLLGIQPKKPRSTGADTVPSENGATV